MCEYWKFLPRSEERGGARLFRVFHLGFFARLCHSHCFCHPLSRLFFSSAAAAPSDRKFIPGSRRDSASLGIVVLYTRSGINRQLRSSDMEVPYAYIHLYTPLSLSLVFVRLRFSPPTRTSQGSLVNKVSTFLLARSFIISLPAPPSRVFREKDALRPRGPSDLGRNLVFPLFCFFLINGSFLFFNSVITWR